MKLNNALEICMNPFYFNRVVALIRGYEILFLINSKELYCSNDDRSLYLKDSDVSIELSFIPQHYEIDAFLIKFGYEFPKYPIYAKLNISNIFITNANLFAVVEGEHLPLEWLNEKLSVKFTYTPTFDLFKDSFTFNSKRSGRHFDRETVAQIAKKNISLSSDKLAPNIIINSTVIYTYSCLEMNVSESEIENCINYLNIAVEMVDKVPTPTGAVVDIKGKRKVVSARLNGTSMHISLLLVKMHFLLYKKDFESVVKVAVNILKIIQNNEFILYYGPNVAKAYVIAVYVSIKNEDVSTFLMFRNAIKDLKVKVDIALNDKDINKMPEQWLKEADESKYFCFSFSKIDEGGLINKEKKLMKLCLQAIRVKSEQYRNIVSDALV